MYSSGSPARVQVAAATHAPASLTSISFVCEPGRLESQAVLLAASLRDAHPDLSLVAAVPRPLPSLTMQALAVLGVSLVAIENPVADDYPIGNKVAALGAGDANGLRVFLDSDMLCLRAMDWPTLRSHPFAAKPADMATFGNMQTWRRLYAHCGLELPMERVVATIGQQMMYPYFNAGMIATTEAVALAPLWAQLCRNIDGMDDVNPRRPWLDQIALPLAAAKLGLAARSLGEDWNFPGHIKPLLGHPFLVHYHQPTVVAREPGLAALVERLLARYPDVAAVVGNDLAWQPLLKAIENRALRSPPRSHHRWISQGLRSRRPADGHQAIEPQTHDLILTGIPRSGTSYVCKGLDRFDNVAVINEPRILFEGLRYGPEPWMVPVLHADFRARIDRGEAVENKLDALGGLTDDTAIQEALGQYRPQLRDGQWVLATKNTLAYLARLEGILRVMPHARVIACVRHPLDTLASWKGTFTHLADGDPSALPVGGPQDPFLPSHLRSGLQELAQLGDSAMRRAAWWRLLAEEILRWRGRVEIVRYEDIVANPDAQMRRLLGPLINAAGNANPALQPSVARTARREILDEADWRAVASLCADVAARFGYDCTQRPVEPV